MMVAILRQGMTFTGKANSLVNPLLNTTLVIFHVKNFHNTIHTFKKKFFKRILKKKNLSFFEFQIFRMFKTLQCNVYPIKKKLIKEKEKLVFDMF